MAKVISKIRAYSPNKKDTPTGNVKHLYYIATRTNAVFNEYGSSIFGYYDYHKLSEDIQKKEVAKYIKSISQAKNNVYRGIISLREDDAIRLGYDKRETWEKMIKNNIFKIRVCWSSTFEKRKSALALYVLGQITENKQVLYIYLSAKQNKRYYNKRYI